MKKATKLLTAIATAAALILGAGAFVSCSNSSDDSSSSQTPEQKAEALEAQINSVVSAFMERGYQEITVENVQSWNDDTDKEYEKLSDEANEFNTALKDANTELKQWIGGGDDQADAAQQDEEPADDDAEDDGNKDDDNKGNEEEIDWDAAIKELEAGLKTAKEKSAAVFEAYDKLSDIEQKAAKEGKNPDGDDDQQS